MDQIPDEKVALLPVTKCSNARFPGHATNGTEGFFIFVMYTELIFFYRKPWRIVVTWVLLSVWDVAVWPFSSKLLHWDVAKSLIVIWAASWQNQQNECAPSEDSDQPGHLPSLIRVFAVCMKKPWILSYPLSAQQRLWSDWADAQADLSLRWAHSHFVGFVISRLKLTCLVLFA